MQLNVRKDILRKQLADGQTPSVLDELNAILSEKSEHFNTVFIRKSNLKNLENQRNNGVISQNDYNVEQNIITQIVLGIVNSLTEDDLKKTDTTGLEKQIAALKIAPVGKLKLVDCDRLVPYTEFGNAYKNLRKLPYQFYFVTAQSVDQPANFAERVVYEIEAKTSGDISQSINFPKKDCKTTGIPRVDFPLLPFDDWGDLSDNQVLFRQHFAERMQHFMANSPSIEDFVANNTKRLPYRYFAFLFKIDFDTFGWKQELTDYLAWIVQTFKKNTSVAPLYSFQFVFIISSDQANVNENTEIKAGIEGILRGGNEAVWLKSFTPVPTADVKSWFKKMTNDHFQNQIDAIIAEATRSLPQPADPLLMKDLEELFLTVYNVSQRL